MENEAGFDAGLATRFVQIASKYTAKIVISYEDKEINAKSIMSLLAMAIAPDEEFILRARGEDEERALRELVKFIKTGQESDYDYMRTDTD